MRTWQTFEFLVNVTEWHSMIMRQVTKLLTAVCVRVGPVGTNCLKSKLHLTWAPSPGLVFDRDLTSWAVRHLSQFLTAAPPVVPPILVGVLLPPGGRRWGSSSRSDTRWYVPDYGGDGNDARQAWLGVRSLLPIGTQMYQDSGWLVALILLTRLGSPLLSILLSCWRGGC
jgi:hypothetical protein